MTKQVLIRPRDPMMFRDGRPFTAGLGAQTIGWPMPSTIAGHIRTRLRGVGAFDEKVVERLRRVEHLGPFLVCETGQGWELAFAAPADAAVYTRGHEGLEIIPLRPEAARNDGAGCDLPKPHGPHLMSVKVPKSEKPAKKAPAFWTSEQTLNWLGQKGTDAWFKTPDDLGYGQLFIQQRLHTEIRKERRNVKEHMLFRTVSLEFDCGEDFHLSPEDRRRGRRESPTPLARGIFSKIRTSEEEGWADTNGLGPLGGEQRLALWSETEDLLPPVPGPRGSLVRLQLVTPGRFDNGWVPSWIESGEPPDTTGLRLRLVSAAVPRFQPLSGFDMTREREQRIRATRFLAPAGSVYFFEVLEGDPNQLWLRSICEKAQDRLDGFGVVLTGEWQWA